LIGGDDRQFTTFTVAAEEYGVDIMAIREIKGWTPTTSLPEAPEHLRGVIDLRARFHHGLSGDADPRHYRGGDRRPDGGAARPRLPVGARCRDRRLTTCRD